MIVIGNTTCTIQNLLERYRSNRSSLITGYLKVEIEGALCPSLTWSYRSNRYSLNTGQRLNLCQTPSCLVSYSYNFSCGFFFFFLFLDKWGTWSWWKLREKWYGLWIKLLKNWIGLLVVTAGVESNGSEERKRGTEMGSSAVCVFLDRSGLCNFREFRWL